MAMNQGNKDLTHMFSELGTWQLIEELNQIVQIKKELTTQELSPVECDPDTGYSYQTVCEYENMILMEIRRRSNQVLSKQKS